MTSYEPAKDVCSTDFSNDTILSDDKSVVLEGKSHQNFGVKGIELKGQRIYKDGDSIDNYDAQCAICMQFMM